MKVVAGGYSGGTNQSCPEGTQSKNGTWGTISSIGQWGSGGGCYLSEGYGTMRDKNIAMCQDSAWKNSIGR